MENEACRGEIQRDGGDIYHKEGSSDKNRLPLAVVYAMMLNFFQSWKAFVGNVYFGIVFPFLASEIFGFVYFISIKPKTVLC